IVIPPLRQRREDIIPLAEHYVSIFLKDMRKKETVLSQDAKELLLSLEWKGNAREVKNVIERALILCDGPTLSKAHFDFVNASIQDYSLDSSGSGFTLHESAQSAARIAEMARIEDALSKTGGNKSRAAEMLKVSYKTLLTKIKEYGIA
ncbi:MAG: sigma-54-dependent Fis family transcriptional regulator, partial [Nitrospirae bacterium]|nr:sigma-54-dependent Fis family transcriptional regulator [Nitrospirota bacterium]